MLIFSLGDKVSWTQEEFVLALGLSWLGRHGGGNVEDTGSAVGSPGETDAQFTVFGPGH